MTLREHVRDLYEALPAGASVTLNRSTLKEWLREDDGAGDLSTAQKVYSTAEAADVLDVQPATVASWCADGRLPNAWKTGTDGGGEWRIPQADLLAMSSSGNNGRGADRVRFD